MHRFTTIHVSSCDADVRNLAKLKARVYLCTQDDDPRESFAPTVVMMVYRGFLGGVLCGSDRK